MTAASEFPITYEELAVREQNGTTVRLLWARGTNIVSVTVVDNTIGEAFEFVLAPDERPLDAFYHPYAYAAARGVTFRTTHMRRTKDAAEYV